jgi:hypothetical protein
MQACRNLTEHRKRPEEVVGQQRAAPATGARCNKAIGALPEGPLQVVSVVSPDADHLIAASLKPPQGGAARAPLKHGVTGAVLKNSFGPRP